MSYIANHGITGTINLLDSQREFQGHVILAKIKYSLFLYIKRSKSWK